MRMTINKNVMWKFFLVLSFLDTVTRFSFFDDLSPYRIVAILVLFIFLIRKIQVYFKSLCVLCVSLVYSAILIIIERGNFHECIDQFVHILFIYTLYVAVKELSRTEESRSGLFKLLDRFTILEIAVFFFEILTGVVLFQSKISKDKASVFSYGINDFIVSIVIPAIIYIVKYAKDRTGKDLIKFSLVFFTTIVAGARASILVLLFAFIISFYWFRILKHLRRTSSKVLSIISLGVVVLIALYIINPVIDDTDIRTLVFSPMFSVFSTGSIGTVGSIALRASALSLGIDRLVKTYGFGVGLGNINFLIANSFDNIHTMHNLLMQFVAEIGWLMILFMFMVIRKVSKDIRMEKGIDSFVELICVLLFPLISVQSSGGVMSCYIMWTCLFYVMCYKSKSTIVNLLLDDY